VAGAAEPPVLVAADAIQPQLAIADDGTLHVVAIHAGNIAVAASRDGGKTFAPPVIAIDAGGRATGGLQRGPRIGIAGKGRITVTAPVVIDEAEREKRYPVAELLLAVSEDGGKTWGRPVRVNEAAKKAPEALHWLAVGPSGEAFVAWLDIRGRKQGQDLFLAAARGAEVGRNVKAASQVCECCAPGIAAGGDGGVTLAYREGGDRPSREIYLLSARPDTGPAGKPLRLNREPSGLRTCPMSAPAVAISRDGKRVAAAWMDQRSGKDARDVFWAFVDAGKVGLDEVVHAEAKGDQDHPSLAFDEAGAAWIAWEDRRSGKKRIHVRSSRPEDPDTPLTGEDEGTVSFPALAAASGLVAVAYESNRDGEDRVFLRVVRSGAGSSRK
jgi:hypothetical protein